MRNCPRLLLNTSTIELWPADLLRARGNADARVLAQADWLLRRKRDGRYLAAHLPQGMMPLIPRLAREPGLDDALDRLQTASGRAGQVLDDVL
ncbi:D-alanyl-D-alanine carboxypeptidase family protein, partial [Xanthomonas oryzae pv. oryzae]